MIIIIIISNPFSKSAKQFRAEDVALLFAALWGRLAITWLAKTCTELSVVVVTVVSIHSAAREWNSLCVLQSRSAHVMRY